MRTRKSSVIIAIAAVMLLALSCKHEPDVVPDGIEVPGGGPDTTGPAPYTDNCDTDTVYFEQDILPLVISNCAGPDCHDQESHEEGLHLYSYAGIMEIVDPFHPNQSDILQDAIWENGEDRMPPDPNAPLTSDQVNLIITWIQQGALNNSCIGGCDTSAVTYSNTVQPLLQSKCAGGSCHDATDPANNMDLTNYAGAYSIANDGSLAGSVQHQTDHTAMPPNQWLSQCEIDQILIWIQDGAPNN